MAAPTDRLSGTFWLLFLYDVCDEIRLDHLRTILGTQPGAREPSFRQPAPDYVRFEKPPAIEFLDPLRIDGGEPLEALMHYYEYGVVSIELQIPFAFDWAQLMHLSSRSIAAPEIEKQAADCVRRSLARARPALVKPYTDWLTEDYYIIQLHHIMKSDGSRVTAAELIADRGQEIAQVVRGEEMPLAEDERAEILQSRRSYYPDDLVVIGWTAALVYDTPEGALPVMQLLEYANSQLIEFRYYDDMLTRLLADVYRSLDKGTGVLARWRLAREAGRLNTIRLDVRELTERMDNSIKFLSDMYSARVYRLAAAKVGVTDYRRLVDDKLHTAGELYQFMVDQFQQGRAFVLELLVVIILVIELVFLFEGKV
ncbi:MAG TPA: hypothetical protein VMR62_35230 [Bryobacteraceae bacterium]|jgi:hypothetical protein|nr:hypothetical protein [Bryobacteraceae bacterium]